MARSLYKGPFVDYHLLEKLQSDDDEGGKGGKGGKGSHIINTYSRRSAIIPMMIGKKIGVHNGKEFVPLIITEEMIGHKLGEFALTRKFKEHSGDRKTAGGAAGGKGGAGKK